MIINQVVSKVLLRRYLGPREKIQTTFLERNGSSYLYDQNKKLLYKYDVIFYPNDVNKMDFS